MFRVILKEMIDYIVIVIGRILSIITIILIYVFTFLFRITVIVYLSIMYCHLSSINVILQILFVLMLLYDQLQVQWDDGKKKLFINIS